MTMLHDSHIVDAIEALPESQLKRLFDNVAPIHICLSADMRYMKDARKAHDRLRTIVRYNGPLSSIVDAVLCDEDLDSDARTLLSMCDPPATSLYSRLYKELMLCAVRRWVRDRVTCPRRDVFLDYDYYGAVLIRIHYGRPSDIVDYCKQYLGSKKAVESPTAKYFVGDACGELAFIANYDALKHLAKESAICLEPT